MRTVSRRRLASTVVALLRQQPKDRERIVRMLAAYMVAHKQHKQTDMLVRDIANELKRVDAHLYAEVASAFPLDAAARDELGAYLRQAAGAKTVELDELVAPELLSGIVVRTADQEMDITARTKLIRLKSLNVTMTREA